jgi:hypothetical protein
MQKPVLDTEREDCGAVDGGCAVPGEHVESIQTNGVLVRGCAVRVYEDQRPHGMGEGQFFSKRDGHVVRIPAITRVKKKQRASAIARTSSAPPRDGL